MDALPLLFVAIVMELPSIIPRSVVSSRDAASSVIGVSSLMTGMRLRNLAKGGRREFTEDETDTSLLIGLYFDMRMTQDRKRRKDH
jgi:hypothetical protein